MDLLDKAKMITGLIRLKEAIYCRRSSWTEADRAEFLEAIQIALAPHAEPRELPSPSIKIVWKNDEHRAGGYSAREIAAWPLENNQDQSNG